MKTIVLDPGHGGKDSGGVGNGLKEKDLVLTIGLAAKKFLEANYKEITVLMTRSTDVFVELIDRAKFANGKQADLFVSIHTNAAGTSVAEGFETFVYSKASAKSKEYQKIMHKVLYENAMFFGDRGMKADNLSVLRNTQAPAILTESGFISSSKDSSVLKDKAKLQKIGEAHALAIAAALKLERKAPLTNNTTYKVGKTFDNQAEAKSLLTSLEKDGHKGFTIYTEKA